MRRINNRAFEIISAELNNCCTNDPLGKAEKQIALQQLERLRKEQGPPASLEELRETIVMLVPQFSDKELQKAAKANQPPGALSKIKWAAIFITSSAGVIWIANLPYPMIRWPVAKTAPILLVPSYMSMDYNYRQAIVKVEQADQLVNKATSPADFELGAKTVKQAQKHLDALPVWFLDYWPQYTYWFGWRFTLDEFKSARANVGRMEAQLFQEKNAQILLSESEQKLNSAKEQYQQASTPADKQTAISAWRLAINQFQQVPRQTFAGKTAQNKLETYQQDLKEIVGLAAGNERISTVIEAAKQFAWQAAKASQNPPHQAAVWKQVENLWEQAIKRLEKVSSEDLTGYTEAQKLLAQYSNNLGQVKIRLHAEENSVATLAQAERKIESLLAQTPTDVNSVDRNRTISSLQSIINELEKVQNGTTAYQKAQELLLSAKNKLKQLQP